MARSPLNDAGRRKLLGAFLSVRARAEVYFGWRPNLPDAGENQLIELAVAGGAGFIVTNNTTDLRGGELRFSRIQVMRPPKFMKGVIR